MSAKKKEKSPLMQRITGHFDLKEVRTIEVKEWGESPDQPLVIYIKPLNMREKSQFVKDAQKYGELQAYVKLLIVKAVDGEGKKMFTIKDEPDLLTETDPQILMSLGVDLAYVLGDKEGEESLAEK